MTEEASSEIAELNPHRSAISENSWYWGCAESAMGIRGIDYSSMQSGATHVEDENRHAARILAPLDPSFRKNLWKKAWVELVLAEVSPDQVRILRLAFEPKGFPWDGDLQRSTSCPPHDSQKSGCGTAMRGRPHSEVDRVKMTHPKPRSQWEINLRNALWIEGYAYRGEKTRKDSREKEDVRDPAHAVSLIELGIDCGAVERVAIERSDWKAKQAITGSLSREDLLLFLRQVAVDAAPIITDGKGQKARATLASIRTITGNTLTPALRAYSEARSMVDEDRRPDRVEEWDRKRHEEAYWSPQGKGGRSIRANILSRVERLQANGR